MIYEKQETYQKEQELKINDSESQLYNESTVINI